MCFAQRWARVVANRIYIEEWHKSLKFTCRGAGGAQSPLDEWRHMLSISGWCSWLNLVFTCCELGEGMNFVIRAS